MQSSTANAQVFASDLGWMALSWHGEKLTRLSFGHPSAAAALAALEADAGPVDEHPSDVPTWVKDLIERLQSYAAGEQTSFDDVPLDLGHLSAFQTRVVRACRRIGRGRVRTYGELAAASGSPRAVRAVGSVMSKNRFPIIVPCHRVVASGGAIGGFSARDGVCLKRRMLELEAANLKQPPKTRRLARV